MSQALADQAAWDFYTAERMLARVESPSAQEIEAIRQAVGAILATRAARVSRNGDRPHSGTGSSAAAILGQAVRSELHGREFSDRDRWWRELALARVALAGARPKGERGGPSSSRGSGGACRGYSGC